MSFFLFLLLRKIVNLYIFLLTEKTFPRSFTLVTSLANAVMIAPPFVKEGQKGFDGRTEYTANPVRTSTAILNETDDIPIRPLPFQKETSPSGRARDGSLNEGSYLPIDARFLEMKHHVIFPLTDYVSVVFRKNKQGRHGRQARGGESEKRSPVRVILFWGLFCALSVTGIWHAYQYRTRSSPLPMLSSPDSSGANIALEAYWLKKVADKDSAIISYVNRGEHCIVSTPKSVYALEMRTGKTLWVNDAAPGLSLQPISKETTLPLLGMRFPGDDKSAVLSRLDPKSGKVLWQIPLEGDAPVVNYDARLIVAYEKMAATGFDLQGNQLWTRHFDDQLIIDYVVFHTGVLLGRYSEKSLTLTYLDQKTGDTLWEEKNSTSNPGYILGRDRQIFYTEDGKSFLMNVHAHTPLWETPLDIGRVLAQATEPNSGTTYVYTTRAAVDPKDGSLLFAYPPGLRFGEITTDFLLLFQESNTRQNTVVLLDASTGAIKKRLKKKLWFSVIYLTEDSTSLYLTATLKPANAGDMRIRSQLLRFQKSTLDIAEIPIGYNLSSLHAVMFAAENVIFIPSYQHLGGYVLPKM